MPASGLSARLVMASERLLRVFGRYLLFLVILNAAFVASLVGRILFFGVMLSPEASVVTSIRTGGLAAAELVKSFSDRPSLPFFEERNELSVGQRIRGPRNGRPARAVSSRRKMTSSSLPAEHVTRPSPPVNYSLDWETSPSTPRSTASIKGVREPLLKAYIPRCFR